MSRDPGNKGSVRDWLSRETPKHLGLLTKLREKLEVSLDDRVDRDPNGVPRTNDMGQPIIIPGDLNDRGTPSRDWCRGYGRYQSGYNTLLMEERERWKLRLQAQQAGLGEELGQLSDSEFDAQMKELALEALRQLPEGELNAELERRRMTGAIDPEDMEL